MDTCILFPLPTSSVISVQFSSVYGKFDFTGMCLVSSASIDIAVDVFISRRNAAAAFM